MDKELVALIDLLITRGYISQNQYTAALTNIEKSTARTPLETEDANLLAKRRANLHFLMKETGIR